MVGTALKGQYDLISIMVPPGVVFKRKKKEKFSRKRNLPRHNTERCMIVQVKYIQLYEVSNKIIIIIISSSLVIILFCNAG